MPDATTPTARRPRNPTGTRCQRLRNHLRAAGYPTVGDYVEPQGDVVPTMFHNADDGVFTFVLLPRAYGSSERILYAKHEGRFVASEHEVLARRPDEDGSRTIQISLRGMPTKVRASLVRASRRAGVPFPRYCIAILSAAASVEEGRRAAGTMAPERSNSDPSVRAAVIADPELGVVSDGDIAGRYRCSTAYVQRIRTELGVPSAAAFAKVRGGG